MHVGTNPGNVQTVDVTVHRRENPTTLAPHGWATTKIAHLSTRRGENRADIRHTSRKFGIATADTSLIVLETLADYVAFDIKPPAELLAAWTAQQRTIVAARRKHRDDHLEAVVAAFAERVDWWERRFPKDTPPPIFNSARKLANTSTPRWLPPAPSVAPLPIRDGADTEEEIVVLSPFEVSADSDQGYTAATTLAGTRMRTELHDVGSAIRVLTPQLVSHMQRAPAATIELQPWIPDAGYLDRLRRATPDGRYAIYLEEAVRREREPGFFIAVADFFFGQAETALARRVLSNLAELELEDVALLRVLAHRLAQADRPDLALPLFERVLALRPDEPQSRRDLALNCADLKQYQRAIDLLWEVVSQPWDDRFLGIELIALAELNAIAATCGEPLDLSRVDRRLQKNLPVQTRVVLSWDANDCDVDLWVTDPNGETANYSNPLSYQGGRISDDMTAGYGPEEFILRDAKPGGYHVEIEYFGDGRVSALGPITAQLRLITDFGLPTQQEKRSTVRLEHARDSLKIGSFEVPANESRAPARKLSRQP